MYVLWQQRGWARALSRQPDWKLALDGDTLVAEVGSEYLQCDLRQLQTIRVATGFPWSSVELHTRDRQLRAGGLPHWRAKRIVDTILSAKADVERRRELEALQVAFGEAGQRVRQWVADLEAAATKQLTEHGWLTREFTELWTANKAATGFGELYGNPTLRAHVEAESAAGSDAIRLWCHSLPDYITRANAARLDNELGVCRDFFDTVEKSPLTDEQKRAVVCFDNRMLVVASAGSGKTSTMVAKAAYAMHRGLIEPDKILMLAFNASAAKELKQRTLERLTPLGLDASQVSAKTFHAFGLEVIGKATGRKPSLAPWLEGGGDIERLGQIVEYLRASDRDFRYHWDFFRAVLARDYPADSAAAENGNEGDDENVDAASASVIRTVRGEVVKSAGERMIANWLAYNGVDYVYERTYERDTADPEHGQYHPDFYYPGIDVYHEHWALDENGQPPEDFTGYLDGMRWKRDLHRKNGTTLVETTAGDLWNGRALRDLAAELTRRGIRLHPDADRTYAGQTVVQNRELVQTFRSFLIHAKSNCLSDEQLRERLEQDPAGRNSDGEVRYRDRAFLTLFVAIRRVWEARLAAEEVIDFEDMLNLSAEHLEAGRWQSPYELVMVDELQDASRARSRLVRALVAQPGRHLFAVGDDWQSINRFAGSDLSVMTQFEQQFGPSETLRLERTFRFPQSIADVSSRFVQKNPAQLAKTVVSSGAEFPPTIGVMSVAKEDAVASAILHRLKTLRKFVLSGAVPPSHGRKLTVLVLGRYRHQAEYLTRSRELEDCLDVRFMTVHASKGAEADYIVILGLVSGRWGFPSTIPDDPVLRLAMPGAESFPRAEERRLFYVALTRARRGVLLVTIDKRESPFLMELIRDFGLTRTNAIGESLESIVCPRCGRAFMVRRESKRRGPFYGCGRYPRCKGVLAVENVHGPQGL
ncbi:UvrD-helicase domain-containing protein [Rathayibacter soli]|uniref:UvrD-helicase domain-containing protein n=1 Tax=Rathayibacter soli TaxID=3144168 RepID=UPI0027E5AFDE|nr:UvrD-helicase domain-containing protein [Glaciibacter superstes]